MYLQQMHLIRMQISTHVMLHKFEKCGGNVSKVNYLPQFVVSLWVPELWSPFETPA